MYIKNKKIEWEFVIDRAYVPLSYSFNLFINNRKYIRKYLNIAEKGVTGQIFYENNVYWVKGLRTEVAEKQIEYHKVEGNKYLWKMAEMCEERGKKLLHDLNDRISQEKIDNLSGEELEKLFCWAVEEIRDFSIFITIPWVMESYLDLLIGNIVKKVFPDTAEEVLAELLLPIKTNTSSEETPAIWELAVQINKDKYLKGIFQEHNIEDALLKNNPEFLYKIDDFIKKYSWVNIRWFKGEPATRKSVIERLTSVILENPEEKILNYQKNKGRIVGFVDDFADKYFLSVEEKDTIFLIKEYVYIRTYRTDTLGQVFYSLFPILERAGELLSLRMEEMMYHTEEEVRQKLLGLNVHVDVESRRKIWAILVLDNMYEIYSGERDVEKLKEEHGVSKRIMSVSEVKGNSVFKGKARGRVKIVLDPYDVPKVEKGDVLVAVMTFPSYIVAMERAVAFVTDEGGILCHASIISRELKKPCIIATKIATSVFKDGDMVEVDADTGFVRKIE